MKVHLIPLAALLLVGVVALGAVYPAYAELRAGAGSAVISPPPGSFIAGDARNRRFAGVHDDIFVKAAVIANDNEAVAVVVIDCIGMLNRDIRAIRSRAAGKLSAGPLKPEHIVIASTHTHCGPDVVGIWGPDEVTTGRDPAYMDALITTAAAQIVQAESRLQPVTARYGTIEGAQSWVENICEPGLLDRMITVLQFVDDGGDAVATLTNFACHPTVMDGVTDLVSSDYVAGFYRAMGERYRGEHLFLQGAIGGWVQPVKSNRSFELASTYGESVAEAAARALERSTPITGDTIRFASKDVTFPLMNEGFKALAEIGVLELGSGETVSSEVAWFQIGNVQFATHPGETSPHYALETRKLMGDGPHFILGLTLDALGYILKPEYFTDPDIKYADYLTSMSVGPETGPKLMEALADVIPE